MLGQTREVLQVRLDELGDILVVRVSKRFPKSMSRLALVSSTSFYRDVRCFEQDFKPGLTARHRSEAHCCDTYFYRSIKVYNVCV